MAKSASQRTKLGFELYLGISEYVAKIGRCYIDIIRADMQAIALAASLRPS